MCETLASNKTSNSCNLRSLTFHNVIVLNSNKTNIASLNYIEGLNYQDVKEIEIIESCRV